MLAKRVCSARRNRQTWRAMPLKQAAHQPKHPRSCRAGSRASCPATGHGNAVPAKRLKTANPGSPASAAIDERSEEHTSELQSLMRISYAVFCLKQKKLITSNKKKNTPNQS